LYTIGIHDNGQLTGLDRENFVAPYMILLDCAIDIGLYTCLRIINRFKGSDSYWGILQVFKRKHYSCGDVLSDVLPEIPKHKIPKYFLSV